MRRTEMKPIVVEKKLTLLTYMWIGFLNLCCGESKNTKLITLQKKLRVVDTLQDFNYILKKINELDVLKKVLLNENQVMCFEYLVKPYRNGEDPVLERQFIGIYKTDERNREALAEYFAGLRVGGSMSEIDYALYNCLTEDVKSHVIKKIEKSIING
jgi:hypothetical protein